ncbi:MAG: glycoside hydrolase family 15 protein, partial [Actinobacteria bacterium]|nr:glycoside hydrolase family 15 protein [Actinomycetota bacterium]
MTASIGDYGFLSDCHAAALVHRTGSIDWYCVPRFDSPAVFARLLGHDGGHWSIAPRDDFRVQRGYVGHSLVLRTVFETPA